MKGYAGADIISIKGYAGADMISTKTMPLPIEYQLIRLGGRLSIEVKGSGMEKI